MKNLIISVGLLLGIGCSHSVQAQVSGTVFRDFNANGAKDNSAIFNEKYVAGITVKAYGADKLQIGSTKTTDAAGAFSFSAGEIAPGTAVRIEFTGLATGDQPGFGGAGNKSEVQFVTAPAASVNFAVSAPDNYWNNIANPDPALMLVQVRRGVANGFYKNNSSLLQINNSSSGPNAPLSGQEMAIDTGQTISQRRVLLFEQTGSVFGLAFQKNQQRFFVAAELKRGSGFGPQGPGGIYMADKSGSYWSHSGGFTLQGVVPSNGGGALDFGLVTRVTSPVTDDNYISDQQNSTLGGSLSDGRDNDAFAKAGTMSYGDIEADPYNDNIYMINTFQKKLIIFNATAASAILNNASAVTLAPFTTAYNITSLPGCPAPVGIGNNIRPYAIKIYKGKGYLGIISDAMATQDLNDLKGYILQFDPANIAAGFTTVVTIHYNLYGTTAPTQPFMHPWVTTWAQAGGTPSTEMRKYPQPMIAGIEFNEDGSMDIATRDRWGNQIGSYYDFIPISGATQHSAGAIHGDILHACWNGTNWNLEGTAGSCTQNIAGVHDVDNNGGGGVFYNNTGMEYYADRSGDGGAENQEGGLAKLMGSGVIVSSVVNPIASGANVTVSCCGGIGVYWDTQGVQWNDNITGLKTQIARTQTGVASVSKTNGMGDIEFALDPQPIQIGNRIWDDSNLNGIQDANEQTPPVAAGTVVTLRSPGINGSFGDGDDQTWTTTTDAAGYYYFSTLSSSDNRKPATWAGVGNTILPGYDYRIEMAIPGAYQITKSNVSANAFDNIDNDATKIGINAVVVFNSSTVNHNFDFGFSLLILPSKFISFTAKKQGEQSLLNFVTAQTATGSVFTVERSTNGNSFQAIGSINGSQTNSYYFTDAFPVQHVINYYRIKETDASGTITYSEIRTLQFATEGKFAIYPVPASNTVSINIDAACIGKSFEISLSNAAGQVVLRKKITRAAQTETIGITSIANGIYQLRIRNDKNIISNNKLVIIK